MDEKILQIPKKKAPTWGEFSEIIIGASDDQYFHRNR